MSVHPNKSVQEVGEIVAEHMDAIKSLFKPDMKITVLLRSSEVPNGSRDFVMMDDTIDDAIAALARRKSDPKGFKGEV